MKPFTSSTLSVIILLLHVYTFVSCTMEISVHSVENIPRYSADTVGTVCQSRILSGYARTHEYNYVFYMLHPGHFSALAL